MLIVAFNIIVDPFGLYNLVNVDGINSPKTEFGERDKLLKAMIVNRIKPQVIFLGSSRVAAAIDPNHPALDNLHPKYNMAVAGSSIYEIRRYLQHAQETHSVKKIVIGLDFFGFNTKRINYGNTGIVDKNLMIHADGTHNSSYKKTVISSTLFSVSAISASFNTLFNAPRFTGGTIEPLTGKQNLYYQGELLDTKHINDIKRYKMVSFLHKIGRDASVKKLFLQMEKTFLEEVYLLGAEREYNFTDPHNRVSSFSELRMIIRICNENNIDLRLFIPPVHARLLEVIRNIGLWSVYEQWKRELVMVVAENKRANEEITPVWDFSGYNSITMENVPLEGFYMKYYYDASHYNLVTGDLILHRIFNDKQSKIQLPEDFGRMITTNNIEQILSIIRDEQDRYHISHAEDVQEVESMAQEAGIYRDYLTIIGGTKPVGGRLVN